MMKAKRLGLFFAGDALKNLREVEKSASSEEILQSLEVLHPGLLQEMYAAKPKHLGASERPQLHLLVKKRVVDDDPVTGARLMMEKSTTKEFTLG